MTKFHAASLLLILSLFITASLLVSHQFNVNLFFDISSLSETIPFDTIVERMPNCTSYDRSRQRSLLELLQAWTQFANQHQIQYWIAYGTLVGYVQRGGLLPHDYDVDVAILAPETRKLVPLVSSNLSSEYYLIVHPQWSTPSHTNRSHHRAQGITFVAPNARFIRRQDGLYVDIWGAHEVHPDHLGKTLDQGEELTEYDNHYHWMSLPRNWTFPLEECRFSQITVWCPAQPKKLVNSVYGITALNVSDRTCKHGLWV